MHKMRKAKVGGKMSHHFYITPEEYKIAESNGISAILLEQRIRQLAWDKKTSD